MRSYFYSLRPGKNISGNLKWYSQVSFKMVDDDPEGPLREYKTETFSNAFWRQEQFVHLAR